MLGLLNWLLLIRPYSGHRQDQAFTEMLQLIEIRLMIFLFTMSVHQSGHVPSRQLIRDFYVCLIPSDVRANPVQLL